MFLETQHSSFPFRPDIPYIMFAICLSKAFSFKYMLPIITVLQLDPSCLKTSLENAVRKPGSTTTKMPALNFYCSQGDSVSNILGPALARFSRPRTFPGWEHMQYQWLVQHLKTSHNNDKLRWPGLGACIASFVLLCCQLLFCRQLGSPTVLLVQSHWQSYWRPHQKSQEGPSNCI